MTPEGRQFIPPLQGGWLVARNARQAGWGGSLSPQCHARIPTVSCPRRRVSSNHRPSWLGAGPTACSSYRRKPVSRGHMHRARCSWIPASAGMTLLGESARNISDFHARAGGHPVITGRCRALLHASSWPGLSRPSTTCNTSACMAVDCHPDGSAPINLQRHGWPGQARP